MLPRLSFGWLIASLAGAVFAAEPVVDSKQLPRIPPTEPANALATFRVKPGFRIELVAAEPLVVDPIALSFDEEGRLYVVEMRDYSERRPERLGRIRLLEDTDGDGCFEKSTVFAQDLPWPTAVICWDGGVFVGATPDILYLKDTSGDGVADVREVIFTGFASDYAPFETNKLNVQALMNSFNWSLDNRIHGATSFSGGKVKLVDSPFVRNWLKHGGVSSPSPPPRERRGKANDEFLLTPALSPRRGGEGESEAAHDASLGSQLSTTNPPLDLRGRDFSFDPRTLEMRAESGGGQHGLSFDNRGRKYVCSNSSHIQTLMYEERYAVRNPYFTMPRALVDIAVDGGAAPVYRISPDEPWRVIRTQWRVSGLVPGPVEGGGRPSGYFTGATGVTIYRGDAFGKDFVGDAFVGDAGGNLVHRKKILPDGIGVRAERPADEQNLEFLASTDNWFRPVQLANGPDGALYICDMYREVIEHPWSLPDSLKKHLDLNNGNDRGRIYRVVPTNFHQPKLPKVGKATTAELVKSLEGPNGWQRDTAARLLYQQQDTSAVPALKKLLSESRSPMARMSALHALDGLRALNESLIIAALSDPSGAVRQHAVQFAEKILANNSESEALPPKLAGLASDPDPLIRYQLAFALSRLSAPQRVELAERLVTSGEIDGWTRRALLLSVGASAWELFSRLERREFKFPGYYESVPALAALIGAQDRTQDVAAVVAKLANWQQPWLTLSTAVGFATGLESRGRSLSAVDPDGKLRPVFALAQSWATNQSGALPVGDLQIESIRLLGFAPAAEASPVLFRLLEARQPQAVQLAALSSLGRFAGPEMPEALLHRWFSLSPAVRSESLSLLLRRVERVDALLTAIQEGSILPAELGPAHLGSLRSHRDERIRKRAMEVLGKAASAPPRQEIIDRFRAALAFPGDATLGHKFFIERCSSCHRLRNEGHALGPDLATVKSGGKEKLLLNILDPNREVAPNFVSYLIETEDGESLLGIVANEAGASVTLRQANGIETTVARPNISSMQSQGKSLMPEGLEAGLSQQDMADLLEFITN
jgi:putative membrane-bound dehydrogenase-like protein